MSKENPTEHPAWAYPGFERDFKVFLLSLSENAITRSEYRDIMRAAGVPLDPEPDPRALRLETPSLNAPQVQLPDLYLIPDNPDYGFDPTNGFVYDLNTGMIVGQLQPDAEEPAAEEPATESPEAQPPVAEELEPGDPGDLPEGVLEDEQVDDDGKAPPS